MVAKRHYGWLAASKFREGVDDEAEPDVDDFTGEKMCYRMQWKIKKVCAHSPGGDD